MVDTQHARAPAHAKHLRRRVRRLRLQNRLYARIALAVVVLLGSAYVYYGDIGFENASPISGSTAPPTSSSGARQLLESTTEDGNYPDDAFTARQRKNGAFLFHVLGVLYVFLALAIVCDEFFVPALEVITDKLDLSEDVAGATFMAAGGSAPELSTSFVGTFFAKSNVGFGTIVGSAVFNVLFVIAACAFAAKNLQLTWWPLARDTTFYSIFLVMLAVFFEDRDIAWWEAAIMLAMYCAYVTFMAFNEKAQEFVRKHFYFHRRTVVDPETGVKKTIEEEMTVEEVVDLQPFQFQKHRRMTIAQLRAHPRLSFHTGALALMLSNADETDGRFKRAAKLVIARNQDLRARGVLPPLRSHLRAQSAPVHTSSGNIQLTGVRVGGTDKPVETNSTEHDDADRRSFSDVVEQAVQRSREGSLADDGEALQDAQASSSMADPEAGKPNGAPPLPPDPQQPAGDGKEASKDAEAQSGEDEDAKPSVYEMACQWPNTWKGRAKVIVLAPIVIPLAYTLPDMSVPSNRRWYPVTFLGSIAWVGVYSYFMVWWASLIGDALGIPPEVMGLTFLAAGTSVPDLLTSVIVAKQGWGDMAVSSSIGSNIFDVGVGLPLPWLCYTLANGESISVGTEGLFISIIVLFLMLLFVILTILYNNWVMTRGMGVAMMVMYVLFVTQNLLVEYEVFG